MNLGNLKSAKKTKDRNQEFENIVVGFQSKCEVYHER